MKKVIVLVLCCSIAFTLTACGRPSAENAVKDYLKDIQKGAIFEDSDAARDAIGDMNLTDDDVADLLLSKFSYKVLSVKEDGNSAMAEVKLTNVDMDAVLEQALTGYLAEALDKVFSESGKDMTDEEYSQLFLEHIVKEIQRKDVEMVSNKVPIHMSYVAKEWVIKPSDQLYDAILGGMLTGEFVQDTLAGKDVSTIAKEVTLNQENEGVLGDSYVVLEKASIAKDYNGKPVVLIAYSWTNNSEETTSAGNSVALEVFQNGISLDPAYIYSGNYDSDAAKKNVRPGSTIQVESAFYIEDMSDIDVEVTENWSFDDTGTVYKTFSLEK